MKATTTEAADGMTAEEIKQIWQGLNRLQKLAPDLTKIDILAVQIYLIDLVKVGR